MSRLKFLISFQAYCTSSHCLISEHCNIYNFIGAVEASFLLSLAVSVALSQWTCRSLIPPLSLAHSRSLSLRTLFLHHQRELPTADSLPHHTYPLCVCEREIERERVVCCMYTHSEKVRVLPRMCTRVHTLTHSPIHKHTTHTQHANKHTHIQTPHTDTHTQPRLINKLISVLYY